MKIFHIPKHLYDKVLDLYVGIYFVCWIHSEIPICSVPKFQEVMKSCGNITSAPFGVLVPGRASHVTCQVEPRRVGRLKRRLHILNPCWTAAGAGGARGQRELTDGWTRSSHMTGSWGATELPAPSPSQQLVSLLAPSAWISRAPAEQIGQSAEDHSPKNSANLPPAASAALTYILSLFLQAAPQNCVEGGQRI